MTVINQFPTAQAQLDFHKGGGFSENPYKKDSHDYREYEKEMHRLMNIELQGIREELAAGV